ncbi:putative Ig domain-containing protein [Oceanicoccus sagamiensis]|uniref:Cadherin domain-containing protein n=1 Tax=Oceanicoccus sagamiensis TaxID=716816 RepID=A0A1X9NF17_9GAMM|nr:putative Ig domain-containing protein [Oceanicoccus sagamiensis]ARN73537.1 hypothetical protein BST96_05020 [Oceanicoccus sagamiensis]
MSVVRVACRCLTNGVIFLLLISLALPVAATGNGGGYRHKNGYGHHDNHSGKYNQHKKRTRWRGPHRGCRVKGDHHHNDQQPGALNCLNAHADPDTLWPANHKFKTVRIEGLTTPSGEAPDITVQCITQDEPLNGQGDGNTDYDAKLLSGNKVKLRKERAGGGNGRVYHIDFLASDTATGESCNGSVAVEVPHHKHGKAQDDGRLFSSVEGLDCIGGNTNSDPEITSTAITTATETVAYTYAVIATDSDGDTLGYELQTSPAGMTINSEGVIEWVPSEGQAGSHAVTVNVADGNNGSAQQTFTLLVDVRPNAAPVINSTPILQGTEEQAYQYQVSAVDDDGDALTYELITAPSTMTINAEGLIQWTPHDGAAADYPVTLQVTDTQGATVEQSYTLTILPKPNTAPSISSTPVLDATENSLYQYSLIATDPDGDALSYTLLTAPASMVINMGVVAWTPDYSSAGEHTVTIEVSDGQGGTASQSYTLTVADTNRAPEINSTPLLESAEGQLYEYTIIATDPDGDALQYAVLEGPNGLSINSDGLVSWIPSYDNEGQHYVSIDITDGKGGSTNQSYTLSVSGTNRDPIIISEPVITGAENTLYEYALQASDDDGDGLSYSLISAPEGMSVSTEGLVSWLPDFDSAGEHTIEVGVSDSDITISQQFIITVANTNQSPVFQYSPELSAKENSFYSMTVAAIDDGDTLTYSLPSAPEGMTITVLTGDITWVPNFNQAGSHNVTVQVDDGQGATISDSFIITVQNTNRPPVIGNNSVTVNEDSSVVINLSANDADAGAVLAFSVITQPANGTLSGVAPSLGYTPNNNFAGTDTFAIEVSDGEGGIVQASVVITVTAVNDSPVFNSAPLNSATSGELYQYLPSVTDPDAGDALTFSVTNAPAGLTVDSLTGELTWIPGSSQVGSHQFTLLVTDSASAQGSLLFNVNVQQGNVAPEVVSQPFTAAVVDNPYRYQINATDPEQDSLSFTLTGNVPTGLVISQGGLLSWTPQSSQLGVHPMSVAISDGHNTISHNFDLRVVAEPVAIPNHLGRDFWLLDDEETEQNIVIITSPVAASGQIEIHTTISGRQTLYPFSLAAGEVIAIDLYHSVNRYENDKVMQRSIHVTADNEVAVYGLYHADASSDAVTAFPSHALGKDYLLMSYAEGEFSASRSALHLIATEDNTTVVITPKDSVNLSGATVVNPGETITRVLNKGDAYSLTDFTRDASGTEIIADKPVAVFGRVNLGFIPIDSFPADRLIEQIPPIELWGSSYVTAPLLTRYSDFYRVMAAFDGTTVSLNGVISHQLDRGEHVNLELDQATSITANQPILVTQYSASDSYDSALAESEPYYYLPQHPDWWRWYYAHDIENYLTSYDVVMDPAPAKNYVIVIMPVTAVDQMTVDGEPVPANAFFNDNGLAGDGYTMAQIALSPGAHTLASSEPFGVYQDVNRLYRYSDPFMAVVPAAEQYLDHYVFTTPTNNFARHFINLTIESDAIATVKLDGELIDPDHFIPIEGSQYAYAQLAVNVGSHQLTADRPLGLLVYGFDRADSYAYVGGFATPSTADAGTLGISLSESTPTLGNETCLAVQALDATGEPQSALAMSLQISGSHNSSATLLTDKYGEASYCYSGYIAGQDAIAVNTANASATATVSWLGAVSPVAPVITSTPETYVLSTTIYQYQVEAIDPNADELTYSLLSAPHTMTIDATTGLISWVAESATELVTVAVTDSTGLTAEQSYQLLANAPPRFEFFPPTEIWITGHSSVINYRTLFRIIDDEHDSIYALSDDISVDPYAYHVYIPGLVVGDYTKSVSFEDEHGETYLFDWQFTVYKNEVPEIVDTQTEHTIKAGERFVWDFDYTDGNGDPNTFRINSVQRVSDTGSYTVPASIDNEGVFSWTPHEAGIWRFSIVVEDSFGDDDNVWVTITVEENPQQYHSPIQPVVVGEQMQYQLDLRSISLSSMTFEVLDAPAGFAVDGNGLVTWQPSASQLGSHLINIEGIDSTGRLRTYTVVVDVTDNEQDPVIISNPLNDARTEVLYSYQLQAIDRQNDPLIWRLDNNAPANMTLSASGLLEWQATEADIGEYLITIEVEDSSGNIGSQQYLLTVTAPGSVLWNRRQCR